MFLPYTSLTTISALKEQRKFAAQNASLSPSLYVWQNHKYFNNKVQVSMQIWKNMNSQKIKTLSRVKGLGNSITKTLAHANSFNLAERQQFKVFLKVAPTLVFWA